MDSSYRYRIHFYRWNAFDLQYLNEIEIYLPSTALGIPIRELITVKYLAYLTGEHSGVTL